MKHLLTAHISALTCLVLWTPLISFGAEEELNIDKFGEANLIPISLGGYSGEVQSVLTFDLSVMGFKIVGADTAHYNVTGNNNSAVEGRVTDRISKAAVLENRRYSGGTLRSQAHAFADDIAFKITGTRGIAQTKIVFKRVSGGQSEIYLADYDGAKPFALTADHSIVAAPCWVPKRQMVCYTSYKSGFPDVFSHDLTSGDRKPVARYPGLNSSAAVSPDGRRVALILSKGGTPDLYVCNLDGSNLSQLTKSRSGEAASSPCWSPDGQTICFAWGSAVSPTLQIISADGGAKRPLRTAGAGRVVTEPDWSPDGRLIAFTVMRGTAQICVVPAQGGEALDLTAGEDPSWAPNSRTLIFVRFQNRRPVLSLLDVKTKQVKDVPQSLGSSQPAWAR